MILNVIGIILAICHQPGWKTILLPGLFLIFLGAVLNSVFISRQKKKQPAQNK